MSSVLESSKASTNERLRVLFITRKFPPSIGGMERLSYQLVKHLSAYADVYVIAWGYGRYFLPLFFLYALIQGVIRARNVDVLHAGDALVAPVVWILGCLYRLPTVVNVHGLDITFNFPGYQALILRLLRRFNRIVCNSRATYEKALVSGLLPNRCRIIYPGVDIPKVIPSRVEARAFIESCVGKSLEDHQVWLTVGRLVPRKGITWFCEQVLPRLHGTARFVYLIVGDGPEAPRLRTVIDKLGLTRHVYWLGRVNDTDLSQLYAGADLFIMPNIPQSHDYEGFGLVAIEAAAHHLPVIAARLDGIQDAVVEGKSGYFLPSKDADAWAAFLQRCLAEPQILEPLRLQAQITVMERFRWDKIVKSYLEVFSEALNEKQLINRRGFNAPSGYHTKSEQSNN
jgi:glycosyltransferase involved in cell wall biosynthesis